MKEVESTAARARLPLWLKMGWTLWIAVWVPLYWDYYGPWNFLWFCDIGNLVLTVALWRESRLLFSWQAVSVFLVQAGMNVDMAGRVLFGFHPIGGTEYMWDPSIPLTIRLLSLFHVVTPWLMLWGLCRLGYDRRAFRVQTLWSWIVLSVSFLGGPEKDLNWTWGPCDHPQNVVPPGLYLTFCMIAYPLGLYLPGHLLLWRLFRCRPGRSGL